MTRSWHPDKSLDQARSELLTSVMHIRSNLPRFRTNPSASADLQACLAHLERGEKRLTRAICKTGKSEGEGGGTHAG